MVRELVAAQIKPERACVLVGLSKSSWHYQPKPRQDSELRQRIHELAREYPRRGYRFIHALLVRTGAKINKKRVRRLWREEGLTVKVKTSKKIRTGASIPMQAEYPNHVWTSMVRTVSSGFDAEVKRPGRMILQFIKTLLQTQIRQYSLGEEEVKRPAFGILH